MGRRSLLIARGALALALLGVVAMAASSCLADLDPPLVCPPPARFAGSNCLDAIVDVKKLGCYARSQVACLSGPRPSCACGPDECPRPSPACFPEGDCPTAVTDAVGAGARCLTLVESDIGLDDPDPTHCVCGCVRCMSACDGVGPVVGFYDDGTSMTAQYLSPIVKLRDLPDQGKIGFYLRLRGLFAAAMVLVHWEPPANPVQLSTNPYYLTVPVGSELVEQVYFENRFLKEDAYAWSTKAQKPTHVVFLSTQGASLYEVDCMIPFLAP